MAEVDLSQYKLLDEIDWILKRPDSMVGALETKTIETNLVKEDGTMEFRSVTYSPALLKIFDEVIQNSYDHSKRPEGKHLNRIDVDINLMTDTISVGDNGGIPVLEHPENGMLIPTLIFGNLRGGSNFDDDKDREGAGRNGLGSKLTNVFSTYFHVMTQDGKQRYERTYEDNMREQSEELISKSTKHGTKITFSPDWNALKTSMTTDNLAIIINRVYEIAACSNHIDVYLNGKKLSVKGFASYVKTADKDALYVENQHWRIGIGHSGKDTNFRQTSFVNSTRTWLGGTHVDYIATQIVDAVREHVKKKTKQDVKPAEIRNHLNLMIDCTVYNPKFNSQTKEYMNLPVSSYGTSIKLDDAFCKKLIKSHIVKEIIEWAEAKKMADDLRERKKLDAELQRSSVKNIPKYEPATEKIDRNSCTLFICEGDSAKNPLMSARDPKKHGIFTLRGKPLSLKDAKLDQIKKNVEIQNLMKVLGLDLSGKTEGLRYGRIVLATDADPDGSHITGLMLSNFGFKWPKLLIDGRVCQMKTPIIRVKKGKDMIEFFTDKDFEDWFANQTSKNFTVKYLKGLGGNSTADFKKFMHEKEYIIPLVWEDDEDKIYLDIAFGDADVKKVWLYGEAK